MTNLLLGGSGFIGSALARELIHRGQKVTSVSLSGEGDAPGVESISINLCHQECPLELIQSADNIFLLNIGQIRDGFKADQEIKTFISLTKSLTKCRARIFYFSSVAVYGHTPVEATEESACRPVGDYGLFKLEAEKILIKNIKPKRLVIMRLANIYGNPRSKGFINVVVSALSEISPTIRINGDGQQKRDYVFIDDLVGAITAIQSKPDQSGIINISTGQSYSLIETVKLVAEVSGRMINYELKGDCVNEPQDSLINNHKLIKDIGFNQFRTFKNGLEETLKNYKIKGKL